MIRILVDSAADYTINEMAEKNIELVPIKVTIGDTEYAEKADTNRDSFYELIMGNEEFPKTSQPSPQEFADVFEDVKEKGDEMICFLLSSALSGTYQSAMLAKSMVDYEKIYIIDSLTATACIRMLSDYAVKLAGENMPAKEIAERIENQKAKVRCAAAVNTLEYLYRGGRLSKATAAIGETVNIKPIITLTESGEVGVLKKCLGKKQALIQTKKILTEADIDNDFPIYSIYSYGTDTLEVLEKKLEKEGYKLEDRIQVGPIIGTHAGPGVYGVIYMVK